MMKAGDIYDLSCHPSPLILYSYSHHLNTSAEVEEYSQFHIPRLSYQQYQAYQPHYTLASAVEEKDWEI